MEEHIETMKTNQEKQKVYIEWLKKSVSRSATNDELYNHAWEIARKAAKLLREHFGVARVRVFGSLLHDYQFNAGSDIDLAVEGLNQDEYWKALAMVLFLDDRMDVNMIDKSLCRPEIWDVVEHEGVDL
jgi:predicted nucleotidyltransferase